jgi:hypothetical protein
LEGAPESAAAPGYDEVVNSPLGRRHLCDRDLMIASH